MQPVIVLTKPRHFDFVLSVLPHAKLVETLPEIEAGGRSLLCFGTGVIVPGEALSRFKWRYNFHAASPSFPGRDPHHWAALSGAPHYGATAHAMREKVDCGPISGVMLVGMPKDSSPAEYAEVGERCAKALFVDLAPRMIEYGLPAIDMQWSGKKRSRADLLALCDMRGVDYMTIEHRQFALQGFEQHFRLEE